MASNIAKIDFRMKSFVDRPGVMRRIAKWKLDQLSRVGAYARGTMQKQIRPRLKRDRHIAVVVVPTAADMPPGWHGPPPNKVHCVVDREAGFVTEASSGQSVGKAIAKKAMAIAFHSLKGKGEGKPPRRGPTDKLRQFILFLIDVEKESVVIGPEPFPRQPAMQGRVSVPELLNKGGVELIAGTPVRFGPRPYVETILPKAIARLKQNITKKPISA